MPTRSLSLDLLRTDGNTQVRASADQPTIDEYAEAWSNGDEFPPAVIFLDGTDYWVGDGHHRIAGARQAERSNVPCDVRQGGQRDALKYALQANSQHGLKRSNADKRRAVTVVLQDSEWGILSNSAIAKLCGFAHNFVAKVRGQLDSESSCDDAEPGVRTGLDGKKRRLPARKPVPATVDAEPDAESDEIEPVEEPVELTTAEFMAEWNSTIEAGCRSISKLAKEVVDELQHMEGRELLDKTSVGIFNDQLKAALQMLRVCKGHAECPHCEGERCKRCDDLGWMAKNKWNSTPRD